MGSVIESNADDLCALLEQSLNHRSRHFYVNEPSQQRPSFVSDSSLLTELPSELGGTKGHTINILKLVAKSGKLLEMIGPICK